MSKRAFLLTALFLLASGCDGITETCALVDCSPGLIVQVRGTLPDTFTISVIPGSSPQFAWTVQCATTSGGPTPLTTVYREICLQGLIFGDFMPAAVRVQVHARGVDREWLFTPEYKTVYPNGRNCGPACRTATVVADVDQ